MRFTYFIPSINNQKHPLNADTGETVVSNAGAVPALKEQLVVAGAWETGFMNQES